MPQDENFGTPSSLCIYARFFCFPAYSYRMVSAGDMRAANHDGRMRHRYIISIVATFKIRIDGHVISTGTKSI